MDITYHHGFGLFVCEKGNYWIYNSAMRTTLRKRMIKKLYEKDINTNTKQHDINSMNRLYETNNK